MTTTVPPYTIATAVPVTHASYWGHQVDDFDVTGKFNDPKPYNPEGTHYKFSYKGIKLDPYRIMQVYNITNPAQQHAIKKLLRAGQSVKSLSQDIDEVIVTLNRWKEMLREDDAS